MLRRSVPATRRRRHGAAPKVDCKESEVLGVLLAGVLGLVCVAHPLCRAYLQQMVARWGLV